ncbi:methyltransferase FkbM family [Thiorhodococcus drewsii AZ1]|uniref:Methyltransferase FkbM family n=1 Tax=Thiorhodococcus drewsii AZ1 TaxID=765913 RepID=G2E378_9GAMM|nr:FkbM family methyltransferase [Thiorhodococcus drewsii]EGV30540.1 methyltransferase FkbM family [Thiorhodococcus drewsii AZ1]
MTKTEGLLGDAIAHHSDGRLDAAEHIYRALLVIDADNDEASHYLGLLALEKGLIDEGLAHLQRALELAPDTSRYWLGLAQGFLIAQRPEQAQVVLDRAEAIGLDLTLTRELRELIDTAFQDRQRQGIETREDPVAKPSECIAPAAVTASAAQQESLVVTIQDGLRIHVPSDIHCLTTYVLLEQGDWLDPGLAFLRRYIQPGMSILDVGAGYGVYALSIAKQMQGQGRVVALEPIAESRSFLNRSIRDNRLESLVTLIPQGLSDSTGEVDIPVDTYGAASRRGNGTSTERVQMLSLDDCLSDPECLAGSRIDLLRLDVSVDTTAILSGGMEFCSVQDPLVMFGITPDEERAVELIEAFARLDMSIYRPIPSLGLLVPLEDERAEDIDRHRSLFACRDQIAARLRQADLMI